MRLNLLDMHVVIASVDKPSHRLKQFALIKALKEKGFKHVKVFNGPKYDPYFVAVAETRLLIFDRYKWLPLIVLEDDATFTEHFSPTIEIPDDAELLYLGCAAYKSSLQFSDVKGYNVKRLLNSYAMHGTVFLTKRGVNKYKRAMNRSIAVRVNPDKVLKTIMPRITVYTPECSFFYQPGHEEVTRVCLEHR